MKSVCTLGGGTGSYTVLRSLKSIENIDITAIVAMSDNGGSTGVLRDEYGVLPPGDVRQCLVALSEDEDIMRKLFSFRYETGTFQGHSFGNIFLSTLETISGSFDQAVHEASRVLKTRGTVLPVTTENIQLELLIDGNVIANGEDTIQNTEIKQNQAVEMRLSPRPRLSQEAEEKLLTADIIVIGPGNLYCSLIPVLLPEGMKETLKKTSAKIVYIANLMQKHLHTDGYRLSDYIKIIESTINRNIDIVITNSTEISNEKLSTYQQSEESTPIEIDYTNLQDIKLIEKDIVSNTITPPKKGDLISRTLIRHDSEKLQKVFQEILKTED